MKQFDVLSTLLHERHSCRAFLDKPVARAQIEQIITTAGRAPSWCNAQPWQVIVTDHDETQILRAALAEHMKSHAPAPDLPFPTQYTNAHQTRRRDCGFQLYDAVGIEKGDRAASGAQMMENFNFFGAPHVAILSSGAELGAYGAMDCGGFITAFTLAAQALGIASIPQAAIASHAQLLRSHFNIGKDRTILCAISFGFENTIHPVNGFRTKRAALSEILDWRGDA